MLKLLYRIFLHNLGLKMVALFATLILWLHVSTEKIMTIEKEVKINYIGPPKNLAVLNPLPDHVTAYIRGRGKTLFLLKFTKIEVPVNLSKLKPGIRTIRIPKEIGFPEERDIKLVGLEPESIVVSVDRITSRRVKVKVLTDGPPKEGFALLKASVLHKNIRLKGPSQLIGDYPVVETEPIPLAGKDSTFETIARLLPPIPMTSLSPESVKVKVYIEPAQLLTLKDLPIRVSGISPQKVELSPQKISVTILGPQSLMKSLTSKQVKARITIEKPGPGDYSLVPNILLPSWARIVEIIPSKVEVKISE